MQIGNQQSYKVKHITTVEDLLMCIDFIAEGYNSFKDPQKARSDMSWADFLRVILRVVRGDPRDGLLVLFLSKNDKPLGYMVVCNDSEGLDKRTAVIYFGYSNGKFAGAAETAQQYIEDWARKHGFSELHAQSRRLNGAAMRLFRKKLGFTPLCIVFKKDL